MNWDDLRIFLAVGRKGSISGGAQLLGVQHSTVSRRIKHLEEKLGARLLERKPSGYELTVAGKNLMETAIDIETQVLGVDTTLLGKDANLVGTLRIAAINNMASSVLMPMFASFNEEYPLIDLHIMVSNSDLSLSQREADIAIRLTNSPTDTLIGKNMVTVASAIYGGRSYLERVAERGEEPKWIGVDCCNFHKSWTKQHSEEHTHHFNSDDTLLTLSAIREGLGISFLPCFMGDADPLLKRYSDPDPEHNLGLWVLFHADLRRTARVLAFRKHISKKINEKKELFEGSCPDYHEKQAKSGRVSFEPVI